MPALRNRRLEQLLGGPIDDTLTYAQVKGLIPSTTEGPDLDFKRDTYGNSDSNKKELCSDVAALANAGGGILILGMDEDDQGRATADPGVSISDDERRRLRQTVVGNVQPTPTFDVIRVEDPARPGTGFLVIWVARSAGAPHAYIPQNKSLLFPKRIGTEKVWLSEGEIAEAYRARFAGLTDRIEQAARIEADFANRLNPDEVFVVVTLVPDMSGSFTIDTAALRDFELSNANKSHGAFGIPMRSFMRSTVRHRRLVGVGSFQPNKHYSRGACELHENGSGVFATAIDARPSGPEPTPHRIIDNNFLVLGVATALRYLGRHARDRTAAGGLATVRATIWPVEAGAPVGLVSSVGWPNEPIGQELVYEPPLADAVADIDDLSTEGVSLVAASYRLASGLFQAFGAPEAPLLTRDGEIRLPYWHRSAHVEIIRWADAAGVKVLKQPLT